ncbi:serine/threonine-protein kinase [Biscogniauxia mediterranea]|nr:serine/threonine-protein kinase [Biscogniauxia mediterranea]
MGSSYHSHPLGNRFPFVKSLEDLTIFEAWGSLASRPKYITFYAISPKEEVFFGQSPKSKEEMDFSDYVSGLEYIRDEEIFPVVPDSMSLTVAPDNLDDASSFIKRPGMNCYEIMKGTGYIPKKMLDEVIAMERVSKAPHPNIVHYYGCRVRRGRITGIVLERLGLTLRQYASTPDYKQLDETAFIEQLASAVDHLHIQGLAHNDISPDNIMVKDGMPVLIDFGSCRPFGNNLQSLGTPRNEEPLFTSEKNHDVHSVRKVQEWLQNRK